MATSIEEILGRDINSLKELREEIKRLQDSIANVDPATQEFKDTTAKLIAAQQQLTSVTRASKDENVAAKDSIVGMEKEYKNLYNTYKMLTEEQRNSSFGKEMESQLNSLSQKLNETKKGVGNFKDNIGHYSEGVIDAFSKMGISVGGLAQPLKLASGGIKTLGASLKALIANPVGAVIMAIVIAFKAMKAIVDKVKEAINNNEDSQMALSEAMSAFQPILDAISNAWDAVGQAVVRFIGFIGDAVRWLREAGAAVTDFLGITKGANERIKEQNELYKSLAQSQNTLTKQKREYQKLNAKDQAEVERLREEASELENGAEKRRLLNEAKEKQAEIDARNVEIAKEELRILTEQSKLTANDAEMNDKLAAAEANVANAEAQASRNARTLNKALKAAASGANGAADAAKKLAEEAKKLNEQLIENDKDELTKLEEKYRKEKALLEKHGYDTTLLTKKYESDRTNLIKTEWEKRINTIIETAKTTRDYETWLQDVQNPKQGEAEKAWLRAENDYKKYKELVNEVSENIDFLSDEGQMDKKLAYFEAIIGKANELGIELQFPPVETEEPWKSRVGQFLVTMVNIRQKFKEEVEALNKIATEEAVDPSAAFAEKLKANQEMYLEALGGTHSKFIMAMAKGDTEYLQLEEQTIQKILDTYEISIEKRIELENLLFNIKKELREQEWAAQEERFKAWMEMGETFFDSMQTGAEAVNTVLSSIKSRKEAEIEADLKEGRISEETANQRKKDLLSYEKTMQAVEITSVVANTAAGIMGVWKAYALEKVANAETAAATGPAAAGTLAVLNAKSLVSAILQTAGLTATGTAQIASIRNGYLSTKTSVEAGANAAAAGTTATPVEIASEPYTYSRTLQTPEDIDELAARPIYVAVSDINEAQKRVQVRDEESSF